MPGARKAHTTIIGDRFELVRRLGAGSFGHVFVAIDQQARQLVAIKVIPLATGEKSARIVCADTLLELAATTAVSGSDIRSEAEILSRIVHPRVVRFLRAFEDAGVLYLVMEYAEGDTLERAAREGALSADPMRVVQLTLQIADALKFVHEKGILHLDLKPSNVRLLPDGDIKLLDFGLSRLIRHQSEESARMIGTPYYMSPEQTGLTPHPIDARSDLYSLGAVVYHLLAGRPPFESDSITELLHKHAEQPPVPLRQWNVDLPPILDAIVMRLLAKDPAARYQSAAGLIRDLEHCLPAGSDREPSKLLVGLWDRFLSLTRDIELGHGDALDKVVDSFSGVQLVEGSEGVGKSRFLARLESKLLVADKPVAVAQAGPALQHTPVVVQLVRGAISTIRAGQDVEAWRAALAEPAPILRLVLDEVPGFDQLCGPFEVAVPQLSGDRARLQYLNAWRTALRLVATGPRPFGFLVDDAHWIDAFSRAVIRQMIRSGDEGGAWCFVFQRGESADGDRWLLTLTGKRRPPPVTRLEPLTREEVLSVTASVFGDSPQSKWLGSQLWQSSRGLPRLVRSGFAATIVAGAAHDEGERLGLDPERVGQVTLPTDDAAGLAHLREAMSDVGRRLARCAALLGDDVSLEILRLASDLSENEWMAGLDVLRRAILLVIRPDASPTFAFASRQAAALLRNEMSPDERREAHRALAARLRSHGDQPEVAAVLAQQLQAGGEREAAAPWMARAGVAELERRRADAAIHYLRLALELGGDQRIDDQQAREWLAEALARVGRLADATHELETALASASDPDEQLRIRVKLAALLTDRLEFKRAAEVAGQALTSLDVSPPSSDAGAALAGMAARYLFGGLLPIRTRDQDKHRLRLVLQALGALSTANYFTGSVPAILWAHLANMHFARRLGDPAELAEAYGRHVMVLTAIPRPLIGRARRAARRAERLATASGDVRVRSSAMLYGGYLSMFRGDYDGARNAFTDAREGARMVGDFLYEYFNAVGLVTIDIRTGQIRSAHQRVQEILRGVGELGRGDATARTDYYLAEIDYWLGRDRLAAERCHRAIGVMRQLNDRQLVARAWWIRAALSWRAGNRAAALEDASDALTFIETHGLHVDFVTQSVCHLGHLCCTALESGAPPGAESVLALARRARDLALKRTRRMPSFRASALMLSARLAALAGSPRRALAQLDRAQRVAQRIGLPPQLAMCHELRGTLLLEREPHRAEAELQNAAGLYMAMGFGAELARMTEAGLVKSAPDLAELSGQRIASSRESDTVRVVGIPPTIASDRRK